jgi:hypothetical protein
MINVEEYRKLNGQIVHRVYYVDAIHGRQLAGQFHSAIAASRFVDSELLPFLAARGVVA